MKVAFDSEARPVLQFLFDIGARGSWLQAKRVAAEIHAIGSGGLLGNMKTIAIGSERIGGGHRQRKISAGLEFDVRHLESLHGYQAIVLFCASRTVGERVL